MAEQKAPEPAPAAAPAPAPSGGKPTLFIILAVVNMLVVAAVGAMIFLNRKRQASQTTLQQVINAEATQEKKEQENPEFIGNIVPLDMFLVNLAGSRGQKLVKVDMELEVSNTSVEKEINDIMPKIRDIIIIILSSKTYAQIATAQGKDELRNEIRDKVNLFLTKGRIKRVYFTQFIYN